MLWCLLSLSSLVEEMRKVSCALWKEETEVHSPDSLFSVVWRLVPRFRYRVYPHKNTLFVVVHVFLNLMTPYQDAHAICCF